MEEELLAGQVAVSQKNWDGVLIEFGSPRALPHLSEHGWSHGETAPDGNTFRWAVEQSAAFTFESDREGKHLAWLECEPFLYQGSPVQWIALTVNGEALTELERSDPRKARVVMLHHFAGLTLEETAAALDVSLPTVEREWRFARALLYTRLSDQEQNS